MVDPVALPAATPVASTGVAPTFTTPSVNANTFQNNGKQFLLVKNASLSLALVVTVDAFPAGNGTPTPDGLAVTDRTVSIPLGTEKLIGPFQPSIYNNPSGQVKVSTDSQTDMGIAVLELTPNSN